MNDYSSANVKALKQYTRLSTESEIENASGHRLIQMLMEGALARIIKAKSYVRNNNTSLKGEYIGMAISIIGGLRDSLDHKTGADIAENLDRLYEYMSNRLLEANVNNDISILEEVHGLMLEIKTAWDSIGQVPPPHANAVKPELLQKRAV